MPLLTSYFDVSRSFLAFHFYFTGYRVSSEKIDFEDRAFASELQSYQSIRGFFTRPRVTLGKPAHQNAYQF